MENRQNSRAAAERDRQMEIKQSHQVPDNTYFRTGDAEPTIEQDGSITILDGNGKHRGWGSPGVTSTVIYDNEDDFVAVHVGFHHKHGGSQFWRYYTTDGEETRRLTWGQLPDQVRQAVLDAYTDHAPTWANSPGKLRSQRKKPSTRKRTTYKLVRLDLDDGKMVSLYDGRTQYQIGKRLVEAVNYDAGEDEWGFVRHGGGYYSHPTPEQVKALYESGNLVPAQCLRDADHLALLECEISGRIAKFPNGKLASTYLKPVRVVEEMTV